MYSNSSENAPDQLKSAPPYFITALLFSFIASVVFLSAILWVKFHRTKQGKIILGLPIAYLIYTTYFLCGYIWVYMPQFKMSQWCTYMGFARATFTAVQLWEFALTVWYALMVTHHSIHPKFGIICHVIIWIISITLGVIEPLVFDSQAAVPQSVYGLGCLREKHWYIFLDFVETVLALSVLVMILTIYITIKRKVPQESADLFKFFLANSGISHNLCFVCCTTSCCHHLAIVGL